MIIPKEVDPVALEFIDRSGLLTAKGEPYNWEDHHFMMEPLCDWHPSQGWDKCSQIGGSETVIPKAYCGAKFFGMNIQYTLPTEGFVEEFVKTKVDKIIEHNDHVLWDMRGNQSVKVIGSGIKQRNIFFKGAFNPESKSKKEQSSKGVSNTVDLLIHDEASRSDGFIIEQMRSRITDSSYHARWLFDNPTYPNNGADYIYRRSDQKHYFVKCSKCNKKQYLDWFRLDQFKWESGTRHCFIDPELKKVICGGCGKPMYDADRLFGEWVKKKRDVTEHRGYWFTRLMSLKQSVAELLQVEENPKTPASYFANFILGKPYLGSDVSVRKEDIIDNLDSEVNRLEGNVMGVDQGKVKWYVIGNSQGIFKVGYTTSWEEIERLFLRYNCVAAVSDALPYPREPKRLAEKYPGKFFRAFYKPESDQQEIARFNPGGGKRKGTVLIRRNEAIDEIVDKMIAKNFPIQAPYSELEDFVNHWTCMNRIVEKDVQGNDRFSWIESDADHLAHATVYFSIALLKSGTAKRARVLGVNPQKHIEKPNAPVIVNDRMESNDILTQALKKANSRKNRF